VEIERFLIIESPTSATGDRSEQKSEKGFKRGGKRLELPFRCRGKSKRFSLKSDRERNEKLRQKKVWGSNRLLRKNKGGTRVQSIKKKRDTATVKPPNDERREKMIRLEDGSSSDDRGKEH